MAVQYIAMQCLAVQYGVVQLGAIEVSAIPNMQYAGASTAASLCVGRCATHSHVLLQYCG